MNFSITSDVDKSWDRFVESHPRATVGHLAAWGQNLVRNLDDLEPGLAELRRVLRPGGRLAILEITRAGLGEILGAFLRDVSVAPVLAAGAARLLEPTGSSRAARGCASAASTSRRGACAR